MRNDKTGEVEKHVVVGKRQVQELVTRPQDEDQD